MMAALKGDEKAGWLVASMAIYSAGAKAVRTAD
jgi:hypothetical protein